MSIPTDRPIPDSYWVRPGRFLAGEYPGDLQPERAVEKVQRLLAAGVTCFVDLTEEGELIPYESLLRTGHATATSIAYHRRPIRDYGVPTVAEMMYILDLIDSALADGQVVYVHCWGGIGRTGTVVGCWLVRHGLTGEQAIVEIARLRRGTPDGWRVAPQSEQQRRLVRTWPLVSTSVARPDTAPRPDLCE